jgi:hypothetical protein
MKGNIFLPDIFFTWEIINSKSSISEYGLNTSKGQTNSTAEKKNFQKKTL